MRLMVDVIQTDLELIKKLHEDYGVPLNFTSEGMHASPPLLYIPFLLSSLYLKYTGIPFISKACKKSCLDLVKCIFSSFFFFFLFLTLTALFSLFFLVLFVYIKTFVYVVYISSKLNPKQAWLSW